MSRFGKYGWVNARLPEAAAVCDRGGEVRKRSHLHKEMVWAGKKLVWNGMLCCRDHIDPPHPQDQYFVPGPDPVPVPNPRPPQVWTLVAESATTSTTAPLDQFILDETPLA